MTVKRIIFKVLAGMLQGFKRGEIMTYEEARSYLDYINKAGIILGLESMEHLLAELGNPQDQLKFIHIAGTNGKGSVLAYVSTILKEAGYRVGRYISPTLFSYRERIQVNEEYISREAVSCYVEKIQQAVERMQEKGMSVPTIFEVETAMAFLHFVDQHCDIVVLETGMGGDTDATNVIQTTVMEVIVSISLDHTAFLGNTLAEIAGHKAGIIKPGTVVVSAKQDPEAMAVIEKRAEECGASLKVADWEQAEEITYGLEEQTFSYGTERDIHIHLGGSYQIKNAVIACVCVQVLRELGYEISDTQMRDGFAKTRWNGRFTVLCKDPMVIIDGAHNPDGAAELEKSICQCLKEKEIYGICGVFKDKEYDKVLHSILPHLKAVTTIQTPGNPRALPAEDLAEAAKKYCTQVHAEKNIEKAVREAMEWAGKVQGVVLAFGSLSFLGEIRKAVEKAESEE